MGLMRSALLAGSESAWLRANAPRVPFVRRAVKRFMPGERLEDAVAAAQQLRQQGLGAVFTHLGENLRAASEADEVREHYVGVYEKIAAAGLDAEISVKPTQLGLDFSAEACAQNLEALAACAARHRNWLWVDMEGSAYTAATLELYRSLRKSHSNVGLCLQAYLYRTAADLKSLLEIGAHIRLVKGAYREPPDKAFRKKSEVDANFYELSRVLLGAEARRAGVRAIFGTHDTALIRRLEELARETALPPQALEFQMLYGIQRAEQQRLAAAGNPMRVLISYGSAWFAWYMRRLAERPANVLFVVKNVFAS